MKVRSLCASALVGMMALSLVGGVTSDAASKSGVSKGAVTVGESGGLDPDKDTRDPEDLEKPIVDPGTDPNKPEITKGEKGQVTVVAVSNMYFANIEKGIYEQNSLARTVKLAEAEFIDPADPAQGIQAKPNGATYDRGAYVQFGDVRSDDYGYSVTVQMTQQFTKGSEKLNGSTIAFSNGILNGNDNQLPGTTNAEKAANYPTATTDLTGFTLTEGTNDKKTLVNATGTQGKGIWAIEYGQSDSWTGNVAGNTGNPGTTGSSVKLTVPAVTTANMTTGDYEANVTWAIEYIPTP